MKIGIICFLASILLSMPNDPSGIFHSYPQKYAKTRRKAVDALAAIHSLSKKGPRTMVGTVVDTTYHASQGYITVTTEMGVLKVYGAPYGALTPQMRVLCRQMGAISNVQSFVFDGFAPNLSRLGIDSGSLCITQPVSGMPYTGSYITPAFSGGTAIGTPSQAGPSGYFWAFFFYIPQLPTSPITLWQMNSSSSPGVYLSCEYQPNGFLRLRSNDNYGYLTVFQVVPHHIHYVQIQPGLTGQEFLVDTVSNYVPLYSTNEPTFAGGGFNSMLNLLSNQDATQMAPVGTWISKWQFGTYFSGSTVLPLVNAIPTSNVNLADRAAPVQASLATYYNLLFDDTPGSSTLANSSTSTGTSGAGGPVAITSTLATMLATGPF